MPDKPGGILATIKDLITRTKGLDDIHDDLAKVPKSDGSVSFNSTALGAINAEVDNALNTAIPASPTSGSVNKIVKDLGTVLPASGTLATVDDLGGGGITAEQLGMLGGAGDDVPFYENWRGLGHQDANLVAFGSLTNTEKLFMQTRYQNAPIWTYQITAGSKVEFDFATQSPYGNYLYLGYGTSTSQARVQALHPIFFTPTDYYQKSTIVVYECLFSTGAIHLTYCQPFIGLVAIDPATIATGTLTYAPHVGFTIGSSGSGMRGSCYNYINTSVTANTSITAGGPMYRAKIVYTLGTDAKFYMNDTLVGTLTNYLPSSQYSLHKAIPFYPVMSVCGSGAADSSWMKVYAIRYYRQNGA